VKDVQEGIDFHSVVGSMAYHRPYEELRKHVDDLARRQRTMIKRTSFAFLYGAGVKRIARTTGISIEEAQKIKNALSEAYPDMMAWWDSTYHAAAYEGKIFTLCGRMRRIPPDQAYTLSVNTVCQGSAADILKYALAEIEVLLQGKKSRQVHHVHDEIHFYLHPEDVDLVPQIVDIMQTRRFDPPKLRGSVYVPITVELNTGINWAEMRETDLSTVQQTLREMGNDESDSKPES
jgi:DNA polymerase-1